MSVAATGRVIGSKTVVNYKLQYLVIFRDDKTNINPDSKSTNLRESAVKKKYKTELYITILAYSY